jgi:hypothetical protein
MVKKKSHSFFQLAPLQRTWKEFRRFSYFTSAKQMAVLTRIHQTIPVIHNMQFHNKF